MRLLNLVIPIVNLASLVLISSGTLSAKVSLVQSVPSPTTLGKLLEWLVSLGLQFSHLFFFGLSFLPLSPYLPTSSLLYHETQFYLSIRMYLCVPPLVGPVSGFCSFVVPSCLLILLQVSLLSAIIYTRQIYTLLKRADPVQCGIFLGDLDFDKVSKSSFRF